MVNINEDKRITFLMVGLLLILTVFMFITFSTVGTHLENNNDMASIK